MFTLKSSKKRIVTIIFIEKGNQATKLTRVASIMTKESIQAIFIDIFTTYIYNNPNSNLTN